jgi:hypothetical protein
MSDNMVTMEMKRLVKIGKVEILRDNNGHLHVYYNRYYRCVISAGFFRDAQISFVEEDDYLELQSMGQGVMRFPLNNTVEFEEDSYAKLLGPIEPSEVIIVKGQSA